MLLALHIFAACGASVGGGEPTYPVRYTDQSGADIPPGSTDVPVDIIFTANFTLEMNGYSLDGNFFIVPGAKSKTTNNNYDSDVCNKDNALPASLVDCESRSVSTCSLKPDEILENSTAYSVCINEDTEFAITHGSFGGSTMSFTTAAPL